MSDDVHMHPLSAVARLILRDPVEGARQLVALGLSRQALWTAFWAAVVLDTVLATLWMTRFLAIAGEALPPDMVAAMEQSASRPFLNVPIQALYWVVVAHAMHRIGGFFGGTGDFAASLTVTVASLGVNLAYLALLVVASVIFPPLVMPVLLGGAVYGLWIVSGMIRGLHGFSSRLAVIVVMIASFLAIYTALSSVLSLLLPSGV
jgi:hypothetical protein